LPPTIEITFLLALSPTTKKARTNSKKVSFSLNFSAREVIIFLRNIRTLKNLQFTNWPLPLVRVQMKVGVLLAALVPRVFFCNKGKEQTDSHYFFNTFSLGRKIEMSIYI
jgi:hypothetical protein